jgi:hypothetical protein
MPSKTTTTPAPAKEQQQPEAPAREKGKAYDLPSGNKRRDF